MAFDGPVARSARPQRGQLPGRPPRMTCRRTGAGTTEDAEGRTGCGIRVHSAFQSSRCAYRRNPASREAGGTRNAPPGHSAGAAECGAAWTADARRGASDPVAEPLVFLPELLVGQGEDLDLPGVGLDLILEFADLGGVVAFAVPALAGERGGAVAEPGLLRFRRWSSRR
jgi:hypothetical protein